jgi:hypothetical protein
MIAVSYGNKHPYSKKVAVDKVAWIDRSEGQFADVEAESATKSERKLRDPHDLVPKDSYTKKSEYQQNEAKVQGLYKELDPLQKQYLTLAKALDEAKDKHVKEEDRKALGRNIARMFVDEKAYPDVAEVAERFHRVAKRKNEVEDEISAMHNYFESQDGGQSKKQREEYGRPEFKEAHGEYEGFKRDESTDSGVDDAVKKGKARVVEMTPEQYIHECAHYIFEGSTFERTLRGRLGDKDTEKYAKMMREGVKFDTPYLKYNAIGEGGQEGLHRAVAAYINGYEKIPVIIIGKRRK